MTMTDAAALALMLVGIAGIIVPILPGSVLVAGGLLLWAVDVNTITAWVVFGVGIAFLVIGAVVKYAVPGRRLKTAGVPRRTIAFGAVLGMVGFFVVPVVGLFAGFVLGIYLAERHRLGAEAAWPATKHALTAVGVSILIELAAAMLALATWIVGVLLVR